MQITQIENRLEASKTNRTDQEETRELSELRSLVETNNEQNELKTY